ncbi:MAG TPA: ABC transporter permease [Pyrinomonadaceae bacterium]
MEILREIRFALRLLKRSPFYTAVAVLTLAFAIGANTVIFSAVNAILLRPLPYQEADRIVYLWLSDVARGIDKMQFSIPELRDFRESGQSFDGVAAYYGGTFSLAAGGQPEQVDGIRVTTDLISLLGGKPLHGRNFLTEEGQPGRHRVVMLGHGLWSRRFNSDPGVVTQAVTINGFTYTVVGVMPPDFYFPDRDTELWVPLPIGSANTTADRTSRYLIAVARLKQGVTPEQAQTEVTTVAGRLAQEYNESKGVGANVFTLQQQVLGDIGLPLKVLLGAVGFILLIACANVASLQLARAAKRSKEIAVRAALGASRADLIRQLLVESALLALMGGALGCLLAAWGMRLLVALGPPNVPRIQEVSIDWRVLLFTLGVSLLTSLLVGLTPALRASRPNLQEELKDGWSSASSGRAGGGVFKVLIVSEVALAMMILTGAMLMGRSFLQLRGVYPGFNNPENVLTMQISLPAAKYGEDPKVTSFFKQLLERVRALPGVSAAGITQVIPLGSGDRYYMAVDAEGHTDPNPRASRPPVAYFQISPDYFRAMGTPLHGGRFFTEQDETLNPPSIIISESLARHYFPEGNPVGQRIRVGSPDSWGEAMPVVGVVADMRFESLSKEPAMQVYTLYNQGVQVGVLRTMVLAVRTASDPLNLTAAVREQVLAVDKDQPVAKVSTMENLLLDSLAQQRFVMYLFTGFAAVALVLATVGLYGVISYTVAQRTHEIGIRMVLGARPFDVLKLIMGQSMLLVLISVVIGLAGAYALSRLIASLIYGISPGDPLTFAVSALVLLVVSAAAIYRPARRATKVDPLVALRNE